MENKFLYHALATGVSGQITLPFEHLMEVQAPSALPFTGGYSASRAEGFRYEHILSFSSAETVTTGSESGGFFHTLATATLEGLNILNVLTADRVVARLASKYSKETDERMTAFAGSHFQNLRIAGCPVEVKIDPEQLKSSRRSERAEFGTFAAPPTWRAASDWNGSRTVASTSLNSARFTSRSLWSRRPTGVSPCSASC